MRPQAVIQVFFDPDCPFCRALWQDLRPYVAQGLQVRWIPVAFLHVDSPGRVAALLAANDPVAALAYNMRYYDTHSRQGGIRPVPVSAARAATLKANDRLWQTLGSATPTILYRQPGSGAVHGARGITERAQIHALFAALLSQDPHAGRDLVKDPF